MDSQKESRSNEIPGIAWFYDVWGSLTQALTCQSKVYVTAIPWTPLWTRTGRPGVAHCSLNHVVQNPYWMFSEDLNGVFDSLVFRTMPKSRQSFTHLTPTVGATWSFVQSWNALSPIWASFFKGEIFHWSNLNVVGLFSPHAGVLPQELCVAAGRTVWSLLEILSSLIHSRLEPDHCHPSGQNVGCGFIDTENVIIITYFDLNSKQATSSPEMKSVLETRAL